MKFIDTWDYEFNLSHLALGFSSVSISGINCINYGFDAEATHTKTNTSGLYKKLIDYPVDNEKIMDLDFESFDKTIKITGFKKAYSKHDFYNLIYIKYISLFLYLRKFKRNLLYK